MKKEVNFIFILGIFLVLALLTPLTAEAVVEIESSGDIVNVLNDIYVSEGQVVTGDAVALLGDITVNGKVRGDTVAILGNIVVNNEIGGEAVSILGTITRGSEAVIGSGITEVSPGQITRNIRLDFFPISGFLGWGVRIAKLLVVYVLAILVIALLPQKTRNMARAINQNTVQKMLLGTGALILWPVFTLGLVISIIGVFLVPVAAIGFFLFRFLGFVAIALFIGQRVKQVGELKVNIFLELLIGVIILEFVGSIPVINIISWLVITILALGLVIGTKFGTGNSWFDLAVVDDTQRSEE